MTNSEIPYEEQFFIIEKPVWFYTEQGHRLVGWNHDHTFYCTGRPVWRKEVAESRVEGHAIELESTSFYFLYDGDGYPVGSARDKEYSTLTKKSITFPRICHYNGYEWFEHADLALVRLKQYYFSIRTQCKIKKTETDLMRITRPVVLSPRAVELQSLNSGLIDRARKISNLSPLERLVLEERGLLKEPGSIQ